MLDSTGMMDASDAMAGNDVWRELHRTTDLDEARTIITCLLAMEFEVCLRDTRGDIAVGALQDETAVRELVGALSIDVRDEDHAELCDILDELLEEQRTFDATIDRRARTGRLIVQLSFMIALLGGTAYFWYLFATGQLP